MKCSRPSSGVFYYKLPFLKMQRQFPEKPRLMGYAPKRLAKEHMGSRGLTDPCRSQMSPRVLLLMIHMEHSTKNCSLAGFALKLVKFIREDFTHSKRRSRNNTAWPKKRNVFVACVPICTPTCTIFPKQLPPGSLRGRKRANFVMKQTTGCRF